MRKRHLNIIMPKLVRLFSWNTVLLRNLENRIKTSRKKHAVDKILKITKTNESIQKCHLL